MPPSRSPTNAMKMPMPTPIDSFSEVGTARTTASRRPATTSTSATTPSITTQAMPTGQPTFWPRMMSKATSALRPSPEASASGMLATRPMTIVATPAASAVATATPVNGTPGLRQDRRVDEHDVATSPGRSTRRRGPLGAASSPARGCGRSGPCRSGIRDVGSRAADGRSVGAAMVSSRQLRDAVAFAHALDRVPDASSLRGAGPRRAAARRPVRRAHAGGGRAAGSPSAAAGRDLDDDELALLELLHVAAAGRCAARGGP